MERDDVVKATSNYHGFLVTSLRQAHTEFDQWIPGADRVTVEGARAKFVHERTLYLWEKQFGKTGSPRLKKEKNLRYLLISEDDYCLGIRNKKTDEQFHTYNHQSKQQDDLRSSGKFLYHDQEPYHIFLGYRLRPGLEPVVTHIFLSSEDSFGVEWKHFLWTLEQGINPIQKIQLVMPPPDELPRPKIKKRRRKGGETGTEPNANQETG